MNVMSNSQAAILGGKDTNSIDSVPKVIETKANVKDGESNNKSTQGDVKKAVEKLNRFLEDEGSHAEYETHDKFKDIIIKIVDNKTNQIITEIPSRKILDLVAKMCEIAGVLVDKRA